MRARERPRRRNAVRVSRIVWGARRLGERARRSGLRVGRTGWLRFGVVKKRQLRVEADGRQPGANMHHVAYGRMVNYKFLTTGHRLVVFQVLGSTFFRGRSLIAATSAPTARRQARGDFLRKCRQREGKSRGR